MADKHRMRGVRVVEWVLIATGIVSLACYGWLTYHARQLEAHNRAAVRDALAARSSPAPASAPSAPAALPSAPPASTNLIGELTIPRLHLSAPVMVGDDDKALAGAIGYLTDTPPPWERGNSAFAAHRDRLFRPLEHIETGDDVMLSTVHGDFTYRVRATMIVDPSDVWILKPAPQVDLTLITCYPFVYVGHAPKRFVVRATKVLN